MTWTRAEDDDLGAIFEAVARPWPAALARLWLRHAEGAATYSRPYWLPKDAPAQVVASMQRRESPGRRALAHVAGLPERQARTVFEDGCWRDPYAQEPSDRPGSVPPASRVPSRVRPGSEPEKVAATVTDRPGSVPPASRVPSRVRPDRARVSLDPNKNPEPEPGEVAAAVTDSLPPAEPSGSPADLWSRAADIAEAVDPEAWRASEQFQPSSDAYVFDDVEPVGVPEQPSIPRQIESPATRAPEAPPQGPRPSPTHPPGNGEGAPGGATAPQSAPSLFGRTDTAPEAQTPAKAPPRARKATAADKAADALAVYGAWRVYHPRAAEAPTPDAVKVLGRILIESGGLDGALLLMEWAHLGTCERARQLRGEAPWPDGRRTVYTDLGSLSRHIASRLEMARDWKDKSTDKDTGLKVLHVPETPCAPFRGRDTTNAMNILADIARRDLERQHGL